jgi:N-acetylated-alpha-linked acidic dipeptidase
MRKPIFILFLSFVFASAIGQTKRIAGYSESSGQAQTETEKKFDSYLNPSNLDLWMKRLAARPHHLGSAYGKESAIFIRDLFNSWGYEAKIETYKVLFPTPKVRIVELTSGGKFKATLKEPALREDATSGQSKEQLPTYNAWSADGDITGELVYVNYGVPDDYEQLERMGIDVKGKIVIARYGGSWRGIKPKVAQEHGAIGCLIYADPKEDGYFQGDVYPKGPFKSMDGVQRGSVVDLPVAPGDPLTPDIGATETAPRIDRKDAINLLKIPVQPISSADAQPLLAALAGPVAPPNWRGALPITYHVGPGKAVVHLKLEFNWDLVDCYNVIAKLKGSELPDEWVVRGNHHDAWVNGASDPVSGIIALMEEARAVSELVKTGWKPKRTLVYCGWDGEEPGLIGSTEWVEHHADELRQKVVAYINSDGNTRGFLNAGGSHTLEAMVGEVSRDVLDPQTGVSVLERRLSLDAVNNSVVKKKKEILDKHALTLVALGSGSDYSPFFQHLGIPSLDLSFGGEGDGGEYHSIYDSYDHYIRFKDPGFAYGIVLAKVAGRVTLRLANAEVLPFDFISFHRTVSGYQTELMTLLENLRERTDVDNQMIREKRYVYAADPAEKYVPPTIKEEVPFLNFASLQNALSALEKESTVYSGLSTSESSALPVISANRLNKILYQAEHKLMYPPGLPQRPWFRHTIYAPGFYTGYGVKTLPGIREAIEQRKWKEAQEQIEIVAKAIESYTAEIRSASKILMTR